MSEANPTETPATQEQGRGPRNGSPPTTRSRTEEQQERDAERESQETNRKDKDKKPYFKGGVTEMDGHVFQLHDESKKASQFSQTVEKLKSYARINLDNATDLDAFFERKMKEPDIKKPGATAPLDTEMKVNVHSLEYITWKDEATEWAARTRNLQTNKSKLVTVSLEQCSKAVKAKLEGTWGYAEAMKSHDLLWLLTKIKGICHNFEECDHRITALNKAKMSLYSYKQGPNQTDTEYYEKFQELVAIIESYGGRVHDEVAAGSPGDQTAADELNDEDERSAFMRDLTLASLFIMNADGPRYSNLRRTLHNDHGKGRDDYPRDLTAAYHMILSYQHDAGPPKHKKKQKERSTEPNGGRGGGGRGRGRGGGRYAQNHVTIGFNLSQYENHFPDGIPENLILLDDCSTVSIFKTASLLTDIRESEEPLYLESNGGGFQETNEVGDCGNLKEVWYNPESIANILALCQVRKVCRVTMDTASEPAMHVHKPNGEIITFREHESGLYVHDTNEANSISGNVVGYSYLQTVAENKKGFTRRQVEQADAARSLHRHLGRPGTERLITAVQQNHVINCPVTADDVRRAETIYGKDVAFLKGKTTAKPAEEHVHVETTNPVPDRILKEHRDVTLCADIFYVLGLVFSLTVSRGIRYFSTRYLADRTAKNILAAVESDCDLYRKRGFDVKSIRADSEYRSIERKIEGTIFDICAADSHVPEAERGVRTVKETTRATIHGMPYKRLPREMAKAVVEFATDSTDALPHPDGVSESMSPASIITGCGKPDFSKMKLEIGEYVQVYDGTSNDTKSRTLGAIALLPTGNANGDHFFLSLATGQRIHRRSWIKLPISDMVISRVEAIAFEEGMPLVSTMNFLDEHDPDGAVDESAYDKDYHPTEEHDSDHVLTSDAYASSDSDDDDSDGDGVFDDIGHHAEYDEAPEERINDQPLRRIQPAVETVDENDCTDTPEQPPPTCEDAEDLFQQTEPAKEEERKTQGEEERETQEEGKPEEEGEREDGGEEPPEYGKHNLPASKNKASGVKKRSSRARRRSMRARKPVIRTNLAQIRRKVAEAYKNAPKTPGDETVDPKIRKAIFSLCLTQMSARKGIEMFGKRAEDALVKEFRQFQELDVFEALDAFKLTDEEKRDALRAISVIKEKRCGKIKGRTVADGSQQRGRYEKSETTSPTISNDALFMSLMIDAKEKRDVATADVPGAYLRADMKDLVILRLTGKTVDLMCEACPDFKKQVVYEGKTKVLYVRCKKAIYGCVMSGLLWYETFTELLSDMGFTINPYDPCVANATINGKQCTIAWYVDDAKISHVDPAVVTDIIDKIEKHFDLEMTVTRGKKHEFLGMQITFRGDGNLDINMSSYIKTAIQRSGLTITRGATTPCASSIFDGKDDTEPISKERREAFHSTAATLIYVGTRARPDILLALGYICGRVHSPTEKDEGRLKRLLEYLYGTQDLLMTLGADSLDSFWTWVDASFALHPDMRSHTGGVISFGRGGIICKSMRQKINTKSSTEAEVIGTSDYLPHTMYVKMFMEAQGYPIQSSTFYQDNESAIKMEKNGKASCGQRSRHIEIRHFFITDRSKAKQIDIVHCPTAQMLADFLTKPLQGSLFRKFRAVLLGHAHINTLKHDTAAPTEERVGNESPAGAHVHSGPIEVPPMERDNDYADGCTDAYRLTKEYDNVDRSHSFENDPVK